VVVAVIGWRSQKTISACEVAMGIRCLLAFLIVAGTGAADVRSDDSAVGRTFHLPQRGTIRATVANWMPTEGIHPKTVEDVLALRRRLVARDYDKAAVEAKAFLDAMEAREIRREIPPPPGGAPAPPQKILSSFSPLEVAFDPGRYSHRLESRHGDLRLITTPHADTEWREITDADAARGLRRQINHYGAEETSYLAHTVGYWFGRTPLMLENDWKVVRSTDEGTLYRCVRTEPRLFTFYVLADPNRDAILAFVWTSGDAETLSQFWLFAGELPADPDRPFVVPRIALNFDPEWTEKNEQFWQVAAAYVDEARFGQEPDASEFTCFLRRGDTYVANSDGKTIRASSIEDAGAGFDVASMTPEDVVSLLDNPAN
jgi:hypothetical protein